MNNADYKRYEYNQSSINKTNDFLKKYGQENSIKTTSELIGFFLNGIADEPTCVLPKGSDHSPIDGDCKMRRSPANFARVEATLFKALRTK